MRVTLEGVALTLCVLVQLQSASAQNPPDEERRCGFSCADKCQQTYCDPKAACVIGWYCKPGFKRDRHGSCIPEARCLTESLLVPDINTIFTIVGCSRIPNAVFSLCRRDVECEATPTIKPLVCQWGCGCATTAFRHPETKQCITREQCNAYLASLASPEIDESVATQENEDDTENPTEECEEEPEPSEEEECEEEPAPTEEEECEEEPAPAEEEECEEEPEPEVQPLEVGSDDNFEEECENDLETASEITITGN